MKSYKFRINGNEYNVDINSVEGNIADVTVNGASYQVEMENAPAPVQKPAQAPAAAVASTGSATTTTPAPKAAAPAGAGKPVTSPLPGVIIEVSVKEGQTVKAGQKVAVL